MLKIKQTLIGHVGKVWHCSWSRQGNYIASCGEDKTVRVWSVTENEDFICIAILEECQSKTVRSCEWSPDGTTIASASFDGTVVVWQIRDNTYRTWDQIACLEGHDNEVKSLAWSFKGSFLATCGRDKKIWMWERMLSGDFECIAMLEGHLQDVKFVCWDSNNVLYSSGYDDLIKLWREVNDEWICFETLPGHSSTVWGLVTCHQNTALVSCSDDKSIRLWQANSLNWCEMSKIENLHADTIYSVDWNTQLNLIVTGGGDNSLVFSEIVVGQSLTDCYLHKLFSFKDCHDGDLNCVRWSPHSSGSFQNLLMTSSDDGTVKIWNYSENLDECKQ